MIIAKELLETKESFDREYPTISIGDAIEIAIELAKYHVTEALKKASENATITNHIPNKDDDRVYKIVDKDSILNAFNLDSIK